jgi:hypothetical protein
MVEAIPVSGEKRLVTRLAATPQKQHEDQNKPP